MLMAGLEAATGRLLEHVARVVAWIGGAILVALATLTVVSVIGRALVPFGLSPIKGDFELVEMGTAVAVFCFMPWCQLHRGHVTVDLFTRALPSRAQAFLGLLGDLSIAAIAVLLCWRLWLGFGEKFPYGSDGLRDALAMGYRPYFPETSYELEVPLWIPYGLAWLGSALFAVVSIYTVWRALNWVISGREAIR